MKTIPEALEEIQIEVDIENSPLPNWYGVSNTEGVIAYFGNESDACAFRLSYINRLLNPINKGN